MHAYVLATLAFLGLVTTTSAVMSAPPATAERIAIPVAGLDQERAPTVERALRALESQGEPPHVKLLAEVELDVERGALALVVAPGQSLRLQQVQRVLTANRVKLRTDRFALGSALLVFEGEAGDGAVEKLQRTLTSDLFAEAEVRREEEPARLVARVVPGEDPATFDSAAKAARSVSQALRLTDVVWSRPKER